YLVSSDLHSFPTRRSSDLHHHHVDSTAPAQYPENNRYADAFLVEQAMQPVDAADRLTVERDHHVPLRQTRLGSRATCLDGEHQRSEEHTSELQSRENLICR